MAPAIQNMNGLKRSERNKIQQESDILQSLSHPNVIPCFETFEEGNELHIVMEFADGGNLRVLVTAQATMEPPQPLSEKSVLKWIAQLVDAVQYLHEKSLIHR